MRQSPETNGNALDIVIAAIDQAIADYEKWAVRPADDSTSLLMLRAIRKNLLKYRLIIECGARF